jgi:hypothetical protein
MIPRFHLLKLKDNSYAQDIDLFIGAANRRRPIPEQRHIKFSWLRCHDDVGESRCYITTATTTAEKSETKEA